MSQYEAGRHVIYAEWGRRPPSSDERFHSCIDVQFAEGGPTGPTLTTPAPTQFPTAAPVAPVDGPTNPPVDIPTLNPTPVPTPLPTPAPVPILWTRRL